MKRKSFHQYGLLIFYSALLSCSAPTELNTEPSTNADEVAVERPSTPPIIAIATPGPTPSKTTEPKDTTDEPSGLTSEPLSLPLLPMPSISPVLLPTPAISPASEFIATPTPEASAEADESTDSAGSDQRLREAFKNQTNNLQIEGAGRVIRLLADDTTGSRHQRFIVELASGQTLLIAHNIDLAPKILDLKVGDNIAFYGEYEWNNQGGVMHWTHKDPAEVHEAGWLRHKNKIYQ